MNPLTNDDVRIEDPTVYFEHRQELYRRLHEERPIFYYEPLDVFVVSKHEDIREVARTPEVFSSARGLNLHQLRLSREEREAYATFYGAGEQMVFADPPRHRELRGLVSRSLAPLALRELYRHVDDQVRQLVASIEPGESFDFVERVASVLPVRVIEHFIGLPSGHDAEIRRWSDALESMKLIRGAEAIREEVAEFARLNDFLREQFDVKRTRPGQDLISTLLEARLDDEPVAEDTLITFCSTFIAGGSDVTRSLLAGMALALAERPEVLARLRTDPRLMKGAVEESLRWVTPARGFLRTATREARLRDTTIAEGQRVYLLFDAGNRDPEVFEKPWTFDIERANAGLHLSFGYGAHMCVAAHMARYEASSLFTELLRRFTSMEVSGEPREIRQVLRNGWYELPLTFS
jgi:cytochrome P450